MIPKKIHYIWIGNSKKPEIVLKCIESWKKHMPSYEIIEWNEKNYDVLKNEYIASAYQYKKWAFVSDYMRFDILYNYGGIYFDTDVELLKPIPAPFFENNAFTGVEDSGEIAPGLIFACEAKFDICLQIMETYNNEIFNYENDKKVLLINQRVTKILDNYGFQKNNSFQIVNGLAIYPDSYFCGYDRIQEKYNIQEETISVHHYAATWMKKGFKNRIKKICRTCVGSKNYKKFVLIKRKFWC